MSNINIIQNLNKVIQNIINIININNSDNINNKNLILDVNDYIESYFVKKLDKQKKYNFGITISLFNNKNITKIFLKILNYKKNFENILFCFIDDGSGFNVFHLIKFLHLRINFLYIKCYKKNNIFKLDKNSNGYLYPLTYYIGNEILKNYCTYLGILNYSSWISNKYFNIAYKIIKNLDKKNILSLFNSNKVNEVFATKNINGEKLLSLNKIKKISLFYHIELYEEIKHYFTGYRIKNYDGNKWDNQLSNYLLKNNYYIYTTQTSYIQHLDFCSNKLKEDIKYKISDLLINPSKYSYLNINNNFKVNNNLLIKSAIYKNKILSDKNTNINKNIMNNKNIINNKNIMNNNNMINNKNMINEYKKNIYTELVGGLGNQLFMLFNVISLSIDHNLKINFTFHNGSNIKRKNIIKYKLGQKLKSNYIENENLNKNIPNLKNYHKIIEKTYKYEKINIPKNKDILVSGYYQSHKYFSHNLNKIKDYFIIDELVINNIKNKLNNNICIIKDKKLLGIHIRLTDYVEKKDFHLNLSIQYYKNILNSLKVDEYNIILFSDDIEKACQLLREINKNINDLNCNNNVNCNNNININNNKINFIKSTDFFDNSDDENMFLLFSLCDTKICCNSSFSLFACIFNEMFKFTNKQLNFFPNKWFAKNGPEHNINQIVPNNRNYVIFEQYLTKKIMFVESSKHINKYKMINRKNKKEIKVAVIFFHKNIYKICKKIWIEDCVNSILNQENVLFDIYEINYGNEDISIFDNINIKHKHQFFKKNYETHTEAMLFLLKQCFDIDNYDIVFNTNLDDIYHSLRFTYQLNNIFENNVLLNSSIWVYIDENNKLVSNGNNNFYFEKKFIWKKIKNYYFDAKGVICKNELKNEIMNKNNIINHSCVCFTKKFWNSYDSYNNLLRYRNDKPFEDLSLWYRALKNGINIDILNKNLIYYRIHNNSIGSTKKENKGDNTYKREMNIQKKMIGFLFIVDNKNIIELIKKIDNLGKKNVFYFMYMDKNLNHLLSKFNNEIKANSKIIYYENKNKIKNENTDKIIKLFDISILIDSDYIYYVKNTMKLEQVNELLNNVKLLGDYKSDAVYNKVHDINK